MVKKIILLGILSLVLVTVLSIFDVIIGVTYPNWITHIIHKMGYMTYGILIYKIATV